MCPVRHSKARHPSKTRSPTSSRSAKDINRDEFRNPNKTIIFYGIKPGIQVAELMTGSSYFTSVIAETVGDAGKLNALNDTRLGPTVSRANARARPGGQAGLQERD